MWVHDGASVIFRALEEIPANTEATFSYFSARGDRQSRRGELQTMCCINCHCDDCKKPTPSIKGELRDQSLPLARLDRLRHVGTTDLHLLKSHQKTPEAATVDMKKAGFGDEVFPMRQLQLQVLYCYVQKKSYINSLKTALKLYPLIDEKQTSRLSPTYHLGMNSVLVFVINASVGNNCKPLQKVMGVLVILLKRQYLEGLEKWTGSNQEVFRHEKNHFLERLDELTLGQKEVVDSREIGKSRKARRAFAAKMNKLMEWAGLPKLSEKDYI